MTHILNNISKVAFAFIFLSSILSCEKKEEKKEETKVENKVVVSDTTIKSAAKPAATVISFKETSFDFGKVNEGDKVEHTFEFTNTGEHPLIISNANASCGCTLPEWTKEPVMPGSNGKIRVKYDSAGKEGKINKTIHSRDNRRKKNRLVQRK